MELKKIVALTAALVVLCSPAWALRRRVSKDAIVNETGVTTPAAAPTTTPAPAATETAIPSNPATPPATAPAAPAQSAPAPLLPAAAPKAEASAAPSSPAWQGMVELSGSLAYVFTNKISDMTHFRARAGIFYTRDLSLGGSVSTSIGGSDNATSVLFTPQYHFPNGSQFLPYAEGRLGLATIHESGNGSDSALALGIGGGVKYFKDPKFALFVQLDDTHYFGGASMTALGFSLGVTRIF